MQLSALKYNNETDISTSIHAYTNKFKLLVEKLCMAKEKWMAGKLNQEYLQNIQATECSSIMTIKTLCVTDDTINYKKMVDKLLKTALHDDFDQEKQQRGRYRRLPDHSKGKTNINGAITSIPCHLLDLIRKGDGLQAAGLILKWKNIWNEEKRHIRSGKLLLNDNRNSKHSKNNKGDYKDRKQKGGNHNNDKKGKKNPRKRRLSIIAEEPVSGTTRQTVKTRKTTAVVSIKDTDEDSKFGIRNNK